MEAAKLAERDLMALDDRLADPIFRKRLSQANKQHIFTQLFMLASQYEAMLVNEVTATKEDVV